jgi:hypothetical protein
MFRGYLPEQASTFARPPGTNPSMSIGGRQEFASLQIGGEHEPVKGYREVADSRLGDGEDSFFGGTAALAGIEEGDFVNGRGIPVGDSHTLFDTAATQIVRDCLRQTDPLMT